MVLSGAEVAATSEPDKTMTLIPQRTVCLVVCNIKITVKRTILFSSVEYSFYLFGASQKRDYLLN